MCALNSPIQPLLVETSSSSYGLIIDPLPQDPLQLLSKKKSQEELDVIKSKGKKLVHSFYLKQNQLINDLLAPVDGPEDDSENLLKVSSFSFSWQAVLFAYLFTIIA